MDLKCNECKPQIADCSICPKTYYGIHLTNNNGHRKVVWVHATNATEAAELALLHNPKYFMF